MKKQRVLIAYVSAGAGHRAASAGLMAAWKELYPQDEVSMVDTLSYTNPIFHQIYSQGYLLLAKKLPLLWRASYYQNEDIARFRPPGRLAWTVRRLLLARFVKKMEKIQPDFIISTHFLASDATTLLKRRGKFHFVFAVVTTDYGLHQAWLANAVDRYYVSTEYMKAELLARRKDLGVDKSRVKATGIPINPRYSQLPSKNELRLKYGLDPEQFTILMFRNVFSRRDFKNFVEYITEVGKPLQLIMVAGREWPIPDWVKKKFVEHNISYRIFGYINFMDEIMALSDLVITKSGGLTTSECMAVGLPMAIYRPYPGQEERNAEFLMESGAGFKLNQIAGLPYRIRELIEVPDKHKGMSQAALRIAAPDAAYKIARDLKAIGS